MTRFGTPPRPCWEVAEKPHHGKDWWEFHKAEEKTGRLPGDATKKAQRQAKVRGAVMQVLTREHQTAQDIANAVGFSEATVNAYLSRLEKEGVVDCIRSKPRYKWALT